MYRYLPVRRYVLLALEWRIQMSKNMKIVGWLCLGGCVVVMAIKIATFGPAAVLGSLFTAAIIVKTAIEHYNS
jgi:hypothetical protein